MSASGLKLYFLGSPRIEFDDQLVELYADGVSKTFESGGWNVVRSVAIPRKTRVVAVKGADVANVRNICALYLV